MARFNALPKGSHFFDISGLGRKASTPISMVCADAMDEQSTPAVQKKANSLRTVKAIYSEMDQVVVACRIFEY
jgi:hypothetical protein